MAVLPSQSRGPLKWRWASPWEAWGPSTPGTWRWRLISPWGESESPRVVLSSQPGVPRQRWLDPRLKYDTRDVEYVTVEDDDRLWKPDTFIRNDKESSFFLVPSKASFLRVYPDGFVLYSVRWGDISDPLLSVIIMTTISCRIKSKLHCLMDLRNYPFDQQECKIMFASCETELTLSVVWNYFFFLFLVGFNTDDLEYVWKDEDPLTVSTVLPQTDFRLIGNSTSSVPVTVAAVTYSTLEVVLNIQRIGSFCVMTQFVPLAMLVLTSLIALWIPTDKAVKIGITVLLLISVSFKAENINSGLPFTNYTKEPTLK